MGGEVHFVAAAPQVGAFAGIISANSAGACVACTQLQLEAAAFVTSGLRVHFIAVHATCSNEAVAHTSATAASTALPLAGLGSHLFSASW